MGPAYGERGSDVTIIGRSDTLLPNEDTDVQETFTDVSARRYAIHTGYEATTPPQDDGEITVHAKNDNAGKLAATGDELLVATGRRPNSDTLQVEDTGIQTDETGFVEVNDVFETTAENVWALGDIVGNYMFWHSALHEAEIIYQNLVHDRQQETNYDGMAHAIFSSPQAASMGKTEQELAEDDRAYVTGTYDYSDAAMGIALTEEDGFVKARADPNNEEILGCHIVGPDASTLIHKVMLAVASGSGTVSDISDAIHIHPALNEVVERAFGNM